MKKALLLPLLIAPFAKAQITNPAPHCAHEYDGGSAPQTHYISKVVVGNFVNVSGTIQQPAPHYIYYNNLPVITVVQNYIYNFNIHTDILGATRQVYIHIDWNKNGVFESVETYTSPVMTGSDSLFSIPITTPMSAATGLTRLRISVVEDNNIGVQLWAGCTSTIDWGETEDYELDVVPFATGFSDAVSSAVNLYPSPAKDNLVVDGDAIKGITIYNVAGKMVLDEKFDSEQRITVSLTDLPPGIYNASIQCGTEVISKAFVKE